MEHGLLAVGAAGHVALFVVYAVVVVGLSVLPAVALGHVATKRGRPFWPWFLTGVVFWLPGVIVLFVKDDLAEKQRADAERFARAISEAARRPPPPR